MKIQIIRLTETTTKISGADFELNMDTPEKAAAVVLQAYRIALATGTSVITLPDGQREAIDLREQASVGVKLELIDDDGSAVRVLVENSLHRILI